MLVRDLRAHDLDAVLALNQEHQEVLSPLDLDGLRALLDSSLATWVVELDGDLAGFAVVFGPGSAYESPNYRWFSERHTDFVYLDRIAVDATARRRGVGSALYDALDDLARARGTIVLCEVNVVPPNEPSLAFHTSRGFAPVGELEHDGGKVTRMLRRDPATASIR